MNVLRRDVATIGARMNRNARDAGHHADINRLEHARLAAAARITQRGDFVDVDGEVDHGKCEVRGCEVRVLAQLLLHHIDDFLAECADFRLVASFQHDAQQRFGA